MEHKSIFDENDSGRKILYIIIGIFVVPIILQVLYLLVILNQWNFFPLLLGLVFQGKRLYRNWKPLLENLTYALLGSFFIFILAHKGTPIEEKIYIITYSFLLFFVLAFLIKFKKNRALIIAKLTEGITLMYSVAILYWIIDFAKFYIYSKIINVFFVAIFILSLFSIINAFTKIPLSKKNRFLLSLWSSIVMVLFALDYIINTYNNGEISNALSFQQGIFVFIQYFLLGVSSIFIAQNIYMIFGFLPDKNEKTLEFSIRRKELINDHVVRFSEQQVSIWHSLFCLIYSTTLFGLNFIFQFVDKQFMIWIVFVSFPIFIICFEFIKGNKQLK